MNYPALIKRPQPPPSIGDTLVIAIRTVVDEESLSSSTRNSGSLIGGAQIPLSKIYDWPLRVTLGPLNLDDEAFLHDTWNVTVSVQKDGRIPTSSRLSRELLLPNNVVIRPPLSFDFK